MGKRKIVCLCGSTRFMDVFAAANSSETRAGNIVLAVGCDMRTDPAVADMSTGERVTLKVALDELHLDKIDMADEVLVLNVGGYVGESTMREVQYARDLGKPVRYWETSAGGGEGWGLGLTIIGIPG